MQLRFEQQGEVITLHAERDGDGWRVRLPDGSEHRITMRRLDGDVVEVIECLSADVTDSPAHLHPVRTFRVPFASAERGVEFSSGGEVFPFIPAGERAETTAHRAASGTLVAPMVGVVADVLVEDGQVVAAYQAVVVVEAMKVMATVEAPFPGTVAKVHVRKGDRVAHGAPLVELTPQEA